MFIGHFAVGLGAKKYAPTVSLGMLFLACQLADLIWPSLVLLGVEKFEIAPGDTVLTPLRFTYYPYSHSLLALFAWSILLAGIYLFLRKGGIRAFSVIAIVVISHWLLDFVTHRADMPITLNEATRVGLGLWNHPALAVTFEISLFVIGTWIYIRRTRALDKIGSYGFWSLVIFLLAIYAANIAGPPPPSIAAVAWSAQAIWIIVVWGFWIDRHRAPAIPER